jgi:hypothetical protein
MYGELDRKSTLVSNKKNRSIVALHGIEFFDSDDNCILTAGFFNNKNAMSRDFVLDDDERVIGIFSRVEKRYS